MKIEIKKRDTDGKREILIDGVNVVDSILDIEVSYISSKIPRLNIAFSPDELYFEDVKSKL